MRWSPFVVMGLLALAAASASAQAPAIPPGTPVRLTLEDAVRRALEGEEVRLARATVRLAHAQVVSARSGALPQIRTQLSYQRTFASPFQTDGGSGFSFDSAASWAPDPTRTDDQRLRYLESQFDSIPPSWVRDLFGGISDLPFGRKNTWTGGLTVSQLLFQGGKVGAGLAGARAFEDAAGAQLDETRQDVVYRTRRAYLDALYAERLVAIAHDGRRLAEEQLRRVELNQRVGSAAEYDLLRARVEVSNQDPQVVAAVNGRDLALRALRALVNIPSESPVELDGSALERSDTLVEVDTAQLQQAVASRRLLDAAEATVDLWRHAVRFYRGDYWPELRFNLYLGAQAYPVGTSPFGERWRRDWNAAVTVSWALFEGLRTRGQVAQAQAELDQARLQLAQTREAVELEVDQARAELLRARVLLDARRQTVSQAAQAHRLAGVRYVNGISTQLEVSDARLALQQAEANEASATRDYLVAIANMERALGRPVPKRLVERRASAEPASAATGTRE